MLSFKWDGTDEESSSVPVQFGRALVGIMILNAAGGAADVDATTTKLIIETSPDPYPEGASQKSAVADEDARWLRSLSDDGQGTQSTDPLAFTIDATAINGEDYGQRIELSPPLFGARRMRLVSDAVEDADFVVEPVFVALQIV